MAKQFLCSLDAPIVETVSGKVRGFQVDGTYTFHGIPYAKAKRFQMPEPFPSWKDRGVYDAHSYGFVCPMLDRETAWGEICVPHRYWPKDENCQYLNVWTQSLDETAKRPVWCGSMVADSLLVHLLSRLPMMGKTFLNLATW